MNARPKENPAIREEPQGDEGSKQLQTRCPLAGSRRTSRRTPSAILLIVMSFR